MAVSRRPSLSSAAAVLVVHRHEHQSSSSDVVILVVYCPRSPPVSWSAVLIRCRHPSLSSVVVIHRHRPTLSLSSSARASEAGDLTPQLFMWGTLICISP